MNSIDKKSPASTRGLKSLEKTINNSLPVAMTNFYNRHDGGRFDNHIYTHNGDIFRIQQFLSIDGGNDSVEQTYRDVFLNNSLTPGGLLPFAVDSSGDYFCVSLRAETKGAIIFFDSEYYDQPDRCQIFLASSFETFVFKLTPDNEQYYRRV